MKSSKFLVICVLLAALESCATVITGTKQRVNIVTVQPGASVYMDGIFKDSTPCIVKIPRTWEAPPQLIIKKDSFQSQEITLQKHFNEIIILNFVNVFGWTIDAASGSFWRYNQPDTVLLEPVKKRR